MASLYVSYINSDKKIVERLLRPFLEQHAILWERSADNDEANPTQYLLTTLAKSDFVLAILTENSVRSELFIDEIRVAQGEKIRIIPIVGQDVILPKFLSEYQAIPLDPNNIQRTIELIAGAIGNLPNTENSKSQEAQDFLTSDNFAKNFHDYLSSIKTGRNFHGWTANGTTEAAFDQSSGYSEREGFVFTNQNYSFVVRSIVEQNNSRLVIDSNNLSSQLASLALNRKETFKNINGVISLMESFAMTIDNNTIGVREVRAALLKSGMKGQVISTFDENRLIWDEVLLDILTWAQHREKARQILSTTAIPPGQDKTKFWLLKIHGPNWLNLAIGGTGFFYADYENKNKRPEYNLYQAIKRGDHGVALDDSEDRGLLFTFEITAPLRLENEPRERFEFKIIQIFERYNFNAGDYSKIHEIQQEFLEGDKRLFEITKPKFDGIIEILSRAKLPFDPATLAYNPPKLSKVFSDSASAELEDNLGIQKDVDALASVMVYKEVTPPLAIGLFGNWGSGKSFFMHKLQKKIELLKVDASKKFCQTVLQINFNSWHYSDANLWASLTTKIFEELEKYGNKKPEELKNLFKHLSSTKELISETENEKTLLDKKIVSLDKEKKIFEHEASEQSGKLANLSFKTIFNKLLTNSALKTEFSGLKRQYSFLKLDEFDDIEREINEVEDVSDKLSKSIKIIPNFLTGWRVVLTVVLFIAIFGLAYYLSQIAAAAEVLFSHYKYLVLGFSGFLATGLNILRPAFEKVNKAHKALKSLNQTISSLKETASQEFEEKRKIIHESLNIAKIESGKLKVEIGQLQLKQVQLEESLNEIVSGKRVIRFIEGRVSDERYLNSLGIISWVRRDFEQLDMLLGQQKDASLIPNVVLEAGRAFDLQRIILYIDDLDRCREDTVVEVLEAINLLLAFPLFVVVVGVDPRWMHNALNKKYPHLNKRLGESAGQNDVIIDGESVATSTDYLEKIFQIPFALKPMNQASKAALISSQLNIAEIPDEKKGDQKNKNTEQPLIEISRLPQIMENNDETDSDHGQVANNIIEKEGIENKQDVDVSKLLITFDEEQAMKALGFLIGDSPRTIKRFINIYRIVRTHEGFRIQNGDEQPYYYAALIILAVITGQPQKMKDFCKMIAEQPESKLFREALSESNLVNPGPNSLLGLIKVPAYANLNYNLNNKIESLTIRVFKANIDLITRFSFSSIYYGTSSSE